MAKEKRIPLSTSIDKKGDKALRLIMQKYGYSRKCDAVNSALIDRASHISTSVREQLEAENERHDTMEITALKKDFADLRETVTSMADILNQFLQGVRQ